MRFGLVLFFCLITLSFLFSFFLTGNNTDAKFFESGFRLGDNTALIDGFRFPLLWYFTIPFYLLFKETAFVLLPLFCFTIGFAFLAKLFQEFNIKLRWLFFSWILVFFSIRFIGQYTRDSVMFVVSCAFAYFFFQSWYKNKSNFFKLLFLCFLAFLETEIGFYFGMADMTKRNYLSNFIRQKFIQKLEESEEEQIFFINFDVVQNFLNRVVSFEQRIA